MKKTILALVLVVCALAAGAQDMPRQPSEAQCQNIISRFPAFRELTQLTFMQLTNTGLVINLCRKYPSQKTAAETRMGLIAIETEQRLQDYVQRHGLQQDFTQEDERGKR
jgi:hypothetical protein